MVHQNSVLRLAANQDTSLVYAFGFECPTPIQQRAIMPIMHGLDVIAQAPNNAGKTAGIVLGIILGVLFIAISSWLIRRWALKRAEARKHFDSTRKSRLFRQQTVFIF